MDDLISRAAAIDAIVSATAFPDAEYIKNLCHNPANSEDWLGGVCDAINAVEDVNTVDAVPVVHARWIDYKDDHQCSACKEHTIFDAYAWKAIQFEFCPWCGARMDGEGRDEGAAD